MSRHKLLAKSALQDSIFLCFTYAARLGVLRYIVGSYSAFFSCAVCITPLSGAFLSSFSMKVYWVGTLVLGIVRHGHTPLVLLVHWLPGFCAAQYWKTNHWFYALLLPVVCMVLFSCNSVGYKALPYAFYWFIPLGLYWLSTSLFARCLISTFIAHAVGSVLWLYAKPALPPSVWIALIPLVWIERLAIAAIMLCMYKLMQWLTHSITSKPNNVGICLNI